MLLLKIMVNYLNNNRNYLFFINNSFIVINLYNNANLTDNN